jgi:ribosomal protein S18 acetylase RimI-like enzyme
MSATQAADGQTAPIVRHAREADDYAVGELLVSAYQSAYAVKMPEVILPEQRLKDLRAVAQKRAEAIVLVLEGTGAESGRVLGTVALWRPASAGSEAWLPNACDMRHLATDPATHGRGFSKLLLDEIERIAFEECKADVICLHVRKGNHGVRRLYESRGFVRDESGDREAPGVVLLAFAKKKIATK